MRRRALFHALNHVGLGHLNRTLGVAEALLAAESPPEVLFLIEGGRELIDATPLPWIQIPAFADFRTERWRKQFELAECEAYTEAVARGAAEVFRPQLLVGDTVIYPPVVGPARAVGARVALVARIGGLVREQLAARDERLAQVDLLVAPHHRGELPAEDEALLDRAGKPVAYVGPIVRRAVSRAQAEKVARLFAEEERMVLVLLGGGGWGFTRQVLEALLAALPAIERAEPAARVCAIVGPHFQGALPAVGGALRHVARFEADLPCFIERAAAVLCLAGYNTMHEVAAAGVPAVCVPCDEADDQLERAREFARRYPAFAVGEARAEALAEALLAALGRRPDEKVRAEVAEEARATAGRLRGALEPLFAAQGDR
ncbi:MAG: hypothetical protein IT371_26125 [Deltaproteobacteria bacterium]|nr:hypothetical protein [Deltaproteobacteria bacterium]